MFYAFPKFFTEFPFALIYVTVELLVIRCVRIDSNLPVWHQCDHFYTNTFSGVLHTLLYYMHLFTLDETQPFWWNVKRQMKITRVRIHKHKDVLVLPFAIKAQWRPIYYLQRMKFCFYLRDNSQFTRKKYMEETMKQSCHFTCTFISFHESHRRRLPYAWAHIYPTLIYGWI